MAVDLENLIDLSLLRYYDEKIKGWTNNKISNTIKTTQFINSSNLPAQGREDVLYVTDDGIKIWDSTTNSYKTIASDSGTSKSDSWTIF